MIVVIFSSFFPVNEKHTCYNLSGLPEESMNGCNSHSGLRKTPSTRVMTFPVVRTNKSTGAGRFPKLEQRRHSFPEISGIRMQHLLIKPKKPSPKRGRLKNKLILKNLLFDDLFGYSSALCGNLHNIHTGTQSAYID